MEDFIATITDPVTGLTAPIRVVVRNNELMFEFPDAPDYNTESERFGLVRAHKGEICIQVMTGGGLEEFTLFNRLELRGHQLTYHDHLPREISAAALAYATSNEGSPVASRVMLAVHMKKVQLYWNGRGFREPVSVSPDHTSDGFFIRWSNEPGDRRHYTTRAHVMIEVEPIDESENSPLDT